MAKQKKSEGTTRPTKQATSQREGTERARDEAREGVGPRYGGEPWEVADERGDRRFGHARNDDTDPSELAPAMAENDDSPSAADPSLAAAEGASEIESGGQHAGMGRGEKPRKTKQRAKPAKAAKPAKPARSAKPAKPARPAKTTAARHTRARRR